MLLSFLLCVTQAAWTWRVILQVVWKTLLKLIILMNLENDLILFFFSCMVLFLNPCPDWDSGFLCSNELHKHLGEVDNCLYMRE